MKHDDVGLRAKAVYFILISGMFARVLKGEFHISGQFKYGLVPVAYASSLKNVNHERFIQDFVGCRLNGCVVSKALHSAVFATSGTN